MRVLLSLVLISTFLGGCQPLATPLGTGGYEATKEVSSGPADTLPDDDGVGTDSAASDHPGPAAGQDSPPKNRDSSPNVFSVAKGTPIEPKTDLPIMNDKFPGGKGDLCVFICNLDEGLVCTPGFGTVENPERRCVKVDVGAGEECGDYDKCLESLECREGRCVDLNVPLGGACDETYTFCAGADNWLAVCRDGLCTPPWRRPLRPRRDPPSEFPTFELRE